MERGFCREKCFASLASRLYERGVGLRELEECQTHPAIVAAVAALIQGKLDRLTEEEMRQYLGFGERQNDHPDPTLRSMG